ncbi:hypothetical protein BDV28DRAFT_138608 [Aspergillus coremiiformis]|uniref:Uncharacterized protein n=1 Tax=Aspergillus coremiiformis TaxID=138285 RepID=A0A5N6YZZ0_9EURO|nr:hypothetical protein BDV28DRAFT_138608 [Aspergillus coremiiformis]
MSHPLVAAVWEQLRRRDITNILREIIGEHATEVAIFQAEQSSDARIEHLMHAVFWIKAIFDLHRACLQGLTNFDGGSYLLPPEMIFSTLMYLVQVKPKLFPCDKPTNPELVKYRHVLALVLLAGARLLPLRGESISHDLKFNLERAIRAAWQDSELPRAERFMVSVLLPQVIGSIGSSDSATGHLFYPALKGSNLTVVTSESHPFHGNTETLITDLLTALLRRNTDQLSSFVPLYDMLWVAESTIVQFHMDQRRISQEKGHILSAALNVDESFDRARENRTKLARTVLAAFDDEYNSSPLQLLATVVLSQNAEAHPPLQTRRIRDKWAQLSRIRDVWDGALCHLVRWLINRRVQLWGCNGELEAVSHDYQQNLTEWLQSSSPLQETSQVSRPDDVLYVVNCPVTHSIPRAVLEERLKGSDKNAYEQLRGNSPYFMLNIPCPLCPTYTRIQHARILESARLSQSRIGFETSSNRTPFFPDSMSRDTTSSSSLSHSTSHSSVRIDSGDGTRSPISPVAFKPGLGGINSKHSPTTASDPMGLFFARTKTDQSYEKPTTKSFPRELKNVTLPFSSSSSLFRRVSAKNNHLPREPRFSFSASGRSLLLWGVGSNWVTRFEIPSVGGQRPKGYRYDVSGVQYSAAGDQRCAVIAAVGEHYELLVFKGFGLSPEAHLPIEIHHHSLPPIHMVMSRDDRYVAFTLKNEVRVYELIPSGIRKVSFGGSEDPSACVCDSMAPPTHIVGSDVTQGQEAIIERKLQFSVDGKYFVIATHLTDSNAYVDVWDLSLKRWDSVPGKSTSFRLSHRTTNNQDLTCVFYDTVHHAIILPAFFEREFPITSSLADKDILHDPASTRIIHAAQSPTESQFAIANGMNQIYLFDSKASGTLRVTRMKKASHRISSSVFRPGYLTLSFPQDDEVLLFWMDNGKLMLRTVRLHDGTQTSKDYDLRSDFDRLMLDRPTSDLQHRRTSLLANPQRAEFEGRLISIPTPTLAELPST